MENPSILSHVSLGTNDLKSAASFYDEVLSTLGCKRIIEHDEAIAYGRVYPEFWIGSPYDDSPCSVGNGTHVAFFATSKKMVDDFYQAAIKAGAKSDGEPGPRPIYGEPFYGCFVHDLDGHKIEATFWDTSLE